jgi:hypothetical protein
MVYGKAWVGRVVVASTASSVAGWALCVALEIQADNDDSMIRGGVCATYCTSHVLFGHYWRDQSRAKSKHPRLQPRVSA